jgi:uncharacterized protein YkwD
MVRANLRRTRIMTLIAAVVGLAMMAFLTGCTPEVSAELRTYSGINAIRQQNGMRPLTPDPGLVEVARARSRDMAARNYFSHQPPDGCNYICIMDRNGVVYAYAGENIAWTNWNWQETADKAVEMWRNSPPHMANILNCHFTRFGSGVARAADGKIYYTMVFEGNAPC